MGSEAKSENLVQVGESHKIKVLNRLLQIRGRQIGDLEEDLAEAEVSVLALRAMVDGERHQRTTQVEALERKVMVLRVELNDVADALMARENGKRPSKRLQRIAADIKDFLFRPERNEGWK